MKTIIETYRGFEITFDTDKERFTFCLDDLQYDEKQSYAACKSTIYKYIKENKSFKPFTAMYIPNHGISILIETITGITKSKRFVYKNDEKNIQISQYNESEWYLFDPLAESIMKEVGDIQIEIDKLRAKQGLLKKQMKLTPIKDVKENYTTD